MAELKSYTCPNCGANTTNADNCEFCGSLLVRFAEKGIDLSNTSYLSNTEVFPGLIKELEQNLAMQEQGDESTATDIYRANSVEGNYVCPSVLRTGKCIWADGQNILLSKSNKGLVIILKFDTYVDTSNLDNIKFNKEWERKLNLFKQLPSYELFTPHNCFYTDPWGAKRKGIEYAIDFGEDAEGAARLISEILIKVYEVPLDENLEFYTNYGVNKVEESRRMVNKSRGNSYDGDDDNDDEGGQSFPSWVYWVAGLILFGLLKMCA